MTVKSSETNILIDPVASTKCEACNCEFNVSNVAPFSKCACPKCGNVQTVPAKLENFTLLNLIGSGGMGAVYHARDDTLGRDVAIKVMLKSVSDNTSFVESFKREAQAAAKLNHPHIAQIYSFGQAKGQLYIVMELVSGTSLDAMIRDFEPIDENLAMEIGLEVAEALQAADEIGLVHGDIKPENILLDEKEQAKLVDFGIASVAGQRSEDGVWGTPYYISPEKAMRKPIDARSDIYSLGATLYHALSKRPPFEGDDPVEVVKARFNTAPEPLRTLREDINEKVESVIQRMLDPYPAKRYPTYASLISDMRLAVEATRQKRGSGSKLTKTRSFIITKKTTSLMKGTGLIDEEDEEGVTSTGRQIRIKKDEMAKVIPAAMQQRKVSKPTGWIVLALFAVVAAVGATIYFRARKKEEVRVQREASVLQEQVKQAEKICQDMELMATNIANAVGEAKNTAWSISMLANDILKETAPEYMSGQKEEPEKPVEAPSVSTDKVESVDMPDGVMSREALERMRERKNKAARKDVQQTEKPVQDEKEEPEVRKKARKTAAMAEEIARQSEQVQAVVAESQNVKNEILATSFIDIAVKNVEKLSTDLAYVQGVEIGVKEKMNAMAAVKLRMEEQKKSLEKIRAMNEIKRKAEEMRLAEEEAQKASIQAEKDRVEKDYENVRKILVDYDFDKAVKFLADQAATYKDVDCKSRMGLIYEKYVYLQQLKLFVISSLNARPFKWGWTQDRYSKDIFGADGNGIRITGDVVVPWKKVSMKQMLKLVDYSLADQQAKASDLARHNLAAAIFCYENKMTQPAGAYANKAIAILPRISEDVGRLAPPQ